MIVRIFEKPPELEAVQWTGDNQAEVDELIGARSKRKGDTLINETLADAHQINLRDWIVTGAYALPRALNDRDFNLRFGKL